MNKFLSYCVILLLAVGVMLVLKATYDSAKYGTAQVVMADGRVWVNEGPHSQCNVQVCTTLNFKGYEKDGTPAIRAITYNESYLSLSRINRLYLQDSIADQLHWDFGFETQDVILTSP